MYPLRAEVAGPAPLHHNDTILIDAAMRSLQVLEFEFFRAAWRFWHGADPADRQIEPGFVRYLFTQWAPGYVRQFARHVLEDAAASGERPVPAPPTAGLRIDPDARGEVVLGSSIFLVALMLLAIF